MRIGVDFDNTIVCYDSVFHTVAVEQGLIPPETAKSKGAVRDYLRGAGKEPEWTQLQGSIYGAYMAIAPAFPGVIDFFTRAVREHIPICIISHRTRFPYEGPKHDLHKAAMDWLISNGFFVASRIGLPAENVFFETTRQAKLERIASAGCTHFIEDLPEFLAEPGFPDNVEKILFDPNKNHPEDKQYMRAASWGDVSRFIFQR